MNKEINLFNQSLIELKEINLFCNFYKKDAATILKALQKYLIVKRDLNKRIKEIKIDYTDASSSIRIRHKIKF